MEVSLLSKYELKTIVTHIIRMLHMRITATML